MSEKDCDCYNCYIRWYIRLDKEIMGEKLKASLDTILNEYVGGAGLYQWLSTLAMMLVKYGSIMPLLLTVFTAYEPSHRCYMPQCESLNGTKVTNDIFNHAWLQFALPTENSSNNYLAVQNKYDGCKMYNFANYSSKTDAGDKIYIFLSHILGSTSKI